MTPSSRRPLLLLFLMAGGLLPWTEARGQEAGITPAPSPLAAEWNARVEAGEVAGVVSLIVTADGTILAADSAGVARPDGPPMGLGTRARIASMTKPVTSVAAMILVEEGVLELDAPIARWLPEFAEMTVAGGEGPAGPVTVAHLLTHRAGFTYGFLDRGPVGTAYRELGVRDAAGPAGESQAGNMARLARAPLAFEPGTRWRYGLSTDVLGHLVEVASGMPLDAFFQTRIFEPLGMTETGFSVADEDAHQVAATWTRTPGGELVPVPGSDRAGPVALLSGGAGLVSTARDYALFARMLLEGGSLDGARILRPETVEAMRTSRTDDLSPPPLGPGNAFGLGFRIAPDGAFGWDGIYGTTFTVDPASGTVRLLMVQHVPRNPGGIEEAFRRLAAEVVAGSGVGAGSTP
jgi:CubicO group peptidase (beta-lactamase class C family)